MVSVQCSSTRTRQTQRATQLMFRHGAGNNSSRRICAPNPCRLRRWSVPNRRLGIFLGDAAGRGIVKSDGNSDRPGDRNDNSGLSAADRSRGSAWHSTASRSASMRPTTIRTACGSSTACGLHWARDLPATCVVVALATVAPHAMLNNVAGVGTKRGRASPGGESQARLRAKGRHFIC